MKLNHLIDALRLADGGELAANLENTRSAVGIGNAIQAILYACDRNQLPNQGQTVYDDMLMSEEYVKVAETAVIQHAFEIVDAYQTGSITQLANIVCGVIEEDLELHVEEFEGRE